jgi:dimethylhistidine N-methyltransferase
VLFLGSTIGNLDPEESVAMLRDLRSALGPGDALLLGADLRKDRSVLEPAYDDALGVTAAFNLNLLARINRELGGKFDLASFEHHAFFNRERSRIEMHLASLKRQRVKLLGECIDFRAGETIHTENSYKYSLESFGAMARGAGWTPVAVWADPDNYFSVHAMTLREEPKGARAVGH